MSTIDSVYAAQQDISDAQQDISDAQQDISDAPQDSSDAPQDSDELIAAGKMAQDFYLANEMDADATKSQLDAAQASASSNLYSAKNDAIQDGTVDAEESKTIGKARSEYNIATIAAGIFA